MSAYNRRKYIPTDAEFFAALQCSVVPENFIRSALLKRGIITSPHEHRDTLAAYFNKLQPSYNEHEQISAFFKANSKTKESCSTSTIKQGDDILNIQDLVNDLQDKLTQEEGVISVNVNMVAGEAVVNVKYLHHDYKLSEFQRNQEYSTQIVVSKDNDGELKIQSTGADKPLKWKTEFVEKIQDSSKDIEIIDINLSGITDSKKRLEFFDFVPKNINGFDLQNITDVYVARLTEEYQEEDQDQDIPRSRPYKITKASFKGQNLMNAPDLKKLLEEGFHLHKIIWESTRSLDASSSMYVMQMHFSDTEDCTNFLHMVKGYRMHEDNDYTKKIYPLSRHEEKEINNLILKSATDALGKIKKPLQNNI